MKPQSLYHPYFFILCALFLITSCTPKSSKNGLISSTAIEGSEAFTIVISPLAGDDTSYSYTMRLKKILESYGGFVAVLDNEGDSESFMKSENLSNKCALRNEALQRCQAADAEGIIYGNIVNGEYRLGVLVRQQMKGAVQLDLSLYTVREEDSSSALSKIINDKMGLVLKHRLNCATSNPDEPERYATFIKKTKHYISEEEGNIHLTIHQRSYALYQLGFALHEYGEKTDDTALLYESRKSYDEALKGWPKSRSPWWWASAHIRRGNVCFALTRADEGIEYMKEAVQNYNSALEIYTREDNPKNWALCQSNKGLSLYQIGWRKNDTNYLEKSIEAFQNALKERTPNNDKQAWAKTYDRLGDASLKLGILSNDAASLSRAWNAYEQSLVVFTRTDSPSKWAHGQRMVGDALSYLGKYENNSSQLELAIQAYEESLTTFTRKTTPKKWALLQFNLGKAYYQLGVLTKQRYDFIKSVSHSVKSHEIWTQQSNPTDWALANYNIGLAYKKTGQYFGDDNAFKLAADNFKSSLNEFHIYYSFNNWYEAQYNLGEVMLSLGALRREANHLYGAIERFNLCLGFVDQYADETIGKAAIFSRIGNAYTHLAELDSWTWNCEYALHSYDKSITLLSPEKSLKQWCDSVNSKASLIRLMGAKDKDVLVLQKAIGNYDDILKNLTRDENPYLWARTINNRANGIGDIAILNKNETNLRKALADYKAAHKVFVELETRREIEVTIENIKRTKEAINLLFNNKMDHLTPPPLSNTIIANLQISPTI